MNTQENDRPEPRPISSGPLQILKQDGELFVTGLGLWIQVRSENEGKEIIRELEDHGYRICY